MDQPAFVLEAFRICERIRLEDQATRLARQQAEHESRMRELESKRRG